MSLMSLMFAAAAQSLESKPISLLQPRIPDVLPKS